MCGIIGTSTNVSGREKAAKLIVHRGPDFQGIYSDDLIDIRHFLLAIRGVVDDSTQPVFSAHSPWVLVFNGQLYNTRHIKKALSTDAPNTEVDTTLIYALIERFGWHFIEYIQGMYAIALYNKSEGILRLYRDQAGQKNLYYTTTHEGISFCSEIKGLVSLHPELHTIDELGVSLAQTIGYIPGERTLIRNINKLNPSEELTYDLRKKELSRRTFKTTGSSYYGSLKPDEVMHMVIAEHLQSKRNIAINLSGGLDSSLIFHEAVTQGYTIDAFSTHFDIHFGNYNTDATLAKKLALEYGQRFTPIEITASSYLDHLIDSYKIIEEPNFNISVPIYYQTTRTEGVNGHGLRVMLSGDGGDELFGGYPHYAKMNRIETFISLCGPHVVNLYKRIRDKRYVDYRDVVEVFLSFRTLSPLNTFNAHALETIQEYLRKVTHELLENYGSKTDGVYQLMLFDRFVWLASENFIRSDKLNMSQSMEMRCPLAYQPLRTYMDGYISSDDYISEKQNKLFLRRLYENKLPAYIVKRADKTGWKAPVEHWYDAKYKTRFLDILSSVENSNTFVDWRMIKKMVEKKDTWPGKKIHLYLSLAILINDFKLSS